MIITDIQMPRKKRFRMNERIRKHNPKDKDDLHERNMKVVWAAPHRGEKEISGQLFEKPFFWNQFDEDRTEPQSINRSLLLLPVDR